jgi:DNA-binding NtrC family response regulator
LFRDGYPVNLQIVARRRGETRQPYDTRGFLAIAHGETRQQALDAHEREYILKTLNQNHGSVTRTAEVLGLERSHLYRTMRTLRIAAKV